MLLPRAVTPRTDALPMPEYVTGAVSLPPPRISRRLGRAPVKQTVSPGFTAGTLSPLARTVHGEATGRRPGVWAVASAGAPTGAPPGAAPVEAAPPGAAPLGAAPPGAAPAE